jgi:hypothetical protein
MVIPNALAPIWYLAEPDLTASARKMSTSDVPRKPRMVHGYMEGNRGRKRRSHCRLNSHAKYRTAQPTRSRKPHLNGKLAWTGGRFTVASLTLMENTIIIIISIETRGMPVIFFKRVSGKVCADSGCAEI